MTAFREAFPILYSDDVRGAVDFYCANFGFDVAYRWPPEGELEFAFLRLDPLGIGLLRRPPDKKGDFELCMYTHDIDAVAAELLLNGVEQVVAPADQPWGERVAYFRDPDGNLIHVTATIATPAE